MTRNRLGIRIMEYKEKYKLWVNGQRYPCLTLLRGYVTDWNWKMKLDCLKPDKRMFGQRPEQQTVRRNITLEYLNSLYKGGSRGGDCSLVRVFLNQNSWNGDIGIKRIIFLGTLSFSMAPLWESPLKEYEKEPH